MAERKKKPSKPAIGTLTVKRLAVGKIKTAEYNPRKDLQPADAEYRRLARSIDTFGYVDSLVWNKRTGNLVGGHQRFKILKERGAKQVDVSVVDLDPAAEKALNVALNNPQLAGEWDEVKLLELLGELNTDPQADATLTGFDEVELAAMGLTAVGQTILQPIDPKAPPRMSWVLVGIPTVRFGEIAATIEHLAGVPGVILESTVNDG